MELIYKYQNTLSTGMEYSDSLLKEIQSQLLSEKRYQHVLRVLDTSFYLGGQFQLSEEEQNSVEKAVLFHDLAKGMSDMHLKKYAEIYQISLGSVPATVYHAIVGAWMAKYFFNIQDQNILDAIYYHTTGSEKFLTNKIGAILFLADFLEPGRGFDNYHIMKYIPSRLCCSLREVVKDKMCSVIRENKILDDQSLSFYHALIKLHT